MYEDLKVIWLKRNELNRGDWVMLDEHTVSTVMSVEKNYVRTTSGDYFKMDKDMKIPKVLAF